MRKEQERFAEALESFDRAIALAPDDPQPHFLRGATLAPASFTYEAIAAYEKCLELEPSHAGALLGRGHLLKGVGRYNEAVASYDACIRERPDTGEAYWSLANLKTYRFSDEVGRRDGAAGARQRPDRAVRGEFPVRAWQGLGGSR